LQDLVRQALAHFQWATKMFAVELDFYVFESAYLLRNQIRSAARLGILPHDWHTLRHEIERMINQAMSNASGKYNSQNAGIVLLSWTIPYSLCGRCKRMGRYELKDKSL